MESSTNIKLVANARDIFENATAQEFDSLVEAKKKEKANKK